MKKKHISEVTEYITNLPTASFKNEHGERFNIYSDGITVWMSGDEVNAMVAEGHKVDGIIPLFNPVFAIWSKDELTKLGQALIEVSS